MIVRFDDHFVRARAVHAVKHTLAFAVETAFDAQSWKFIGYHAQRPSGRVPSAAIAAIGQNFRRGLSFVAGAERTNSDSLDPNALAHEIRGAPGAIRGNDDPAASDRVSAKFRQPYLLDSKRSMEDRTRTLEIYSTTASAEGAVLFRCCSGSFGSERPLVETHRRACAGTGLDGEDVKTIGHCFCAPRAKKLPRHARDVPALV